MEEKKKRMSPILIIILTIIGICLVGFCTWYGINYFKGEEKSVEEQSSVIEQQEPTNNDTGEKIDCSKVKLVHLIHRRIKSIFENLNSTP